MFFLYKVNIKQSHRKINIFFTWKCLKQSFFPIFLCIYELIMITNKNRRIKIVYNIYETGKSFKDQKSKKNLGNEQNKIEIIFIS